MEIGVRIIVQGLVQGVGFRYYVYHHATRLGLGGFVRNLPSGDVEIVAAGERGLIEELIKQVKVGPRAAHVRNVKIEWQDSVPEYREFEIR
jgi:acylphosphatase